VLTNVETEFHTTSAEGSTIGVHDVLDRGARRELRLRRSSPAGAAEKSDALNSERPTKRSRKTFASTTPFEFARVTDAAVDAGTGAATALRYDIDWKNDMKGRSTGGQ
jgi:hypothetical protein